MYQNERHKCFKDDWRPRNCCKRWSNSNTSWSYARVSPTVSPAFKIFKIWYFLYSRIRNSDGEYDETYNETPGAHQIGRRYRGKDFLFKPKEKSVKAGFQNDILISLALRSGFLLVSFWKPIIEHIRISSEKEKDSRWQTSGTKTTDSNE